MKKIILGMFVFALLASTVVYAERGENNQNEREYRTATSTRSDLRNKNATSTRDIKNRSVDVVCVSKAVSTREDSIASAWTTFSEKITTTLTARKTALTNAWALTDAKERKNAVKLALKNSKDSKKAASMEYNKTKKTAWTTFKTAAKTCGGSASIEASGEKDEGEKVEI